MEPISKGLVRDILHYGVMAPSGDNCQPWRFEVDGNKINIFNIPERDQSLYSFDQRASYFAHGALLENISIAATHFGYTVEKILFPDKVRPDWTASCALIKTGASENNLFPSISRRVTNRKPYRNISLSISEQEALSALSKTESDVTLVFTADASKRNLIGYAASVNEEMLFSTEKMHHFFFNHINWTKASDEKMRTGFYIKTLELPGPAKPMFQLMKNWKIAKLLGKAGLSIQIANGNAKNIYTTGALSGVVAIHSQKPENFLRAGMLMERLWLTVTSVGLSLQPMAGITFLMQGILAGQRGSFTNEQVNKITKAYTDLKGGFGLTRENDFLVMAFRIGHADPPSANSLRLSPEIIFT